MSSPAAAQRVASTIGTLKWVVIVALLLLAVLIVIAGFAAGDNLAVFGFVSALSLILSAVVTWVMFGWFEHTLAMLSQVALNTSGSGGSLYSPMQHS